MRGRFLNISLVAIFCSILLVNFSQAQTGLSGKKSGQLADPVVEAKKLAQQIDDLIEKRWKGTKIKPAPLSSDAEFFRRLHLDIGGRVPFLLETRDFLEDEATDKRSKWIEKLMEGDRYSIHFSYVWRSIMLPTKADPQSLAGGNLFELWLKDRLKKNLSYDQLAKEVLNTARNAGEQGNPVFFYTANGNKPEDKASPAARVFLGVKLECAQCHAHPFAEWTRDQFWQTAAFFTQQTNIGNFQPGLEVQFAQIPVQPVAQNGSFPRPSITIPGDKKKTVKATFLDGTEPKETSPYNGPAVLANWIATKENKFFAKAAVDHVWGHFFGVSLLDPILDNDKTAITHPELLNHLAKEFANHDFDLKYLIRAIVYTKAYQRTSKSATKDEEQLAFFARMPVRGLSPEQLYDSIFMVTNPMYEEPAQQNNMYVQQVQFNGNGGPRTQFLLKFIDPTKRTEAHTSILQALFMMNGGFLNEKIDPKKNSWLPVLASTSGDSKRQVETVYLIALGRVPTQNELGRLIPFVESGGPTHDRAQALADVLWALLNSSEFMVNH